ncbi:MAG: FAD-binding oxidoreductase [Aigarchaeota archaeon]|nr:FAD-binding oxidoreductase [Candidatus Pelearchaeum maunauluense]
MPDYDILVIGSGILGLTTAFYAKKQNPKLSVAVIDRERGAGQGNTARSVGGYRRGIFTSHVNRILAETSIDFYRKMERDGEYSFGMRELGYLILLTKSRYNSIGGYLAPILKAGKARLLDSRELSSVLGMVTSFEGDEEAELLELEDIEYGLFAHECGQLDVEKLVSFYFEKCKEQGVEFIFGKNVERLTLVPKKPLGIPNEPRVWQGKAIGGVETDSGKITAQQVVVAAGVWSPHLLDPLGVDCFVKAKKRQLAVVRASSNELAALLHRGGLNKLGTPPMMFFPKGLYLVPRESEGCFWVGLTDDIGRAFEIDMTPEERFYYDNAQPMLAKYFPEFSAARPESMWAGCYSMNMLDGNPIIFRFLNCVVVTGASGSGAMKADAIGRIASALLMNKSVAVLHGGIPFDVSILGVENRQVDKEYLIL